MEMSGQLRVQVALPQAPLWLDRKPGGPKRRSKGFSEKETFLLPPEHKPRIFCSTKILRYSTVPGAVPVGRGDDVSFASSLWSAGITINFAAALNKVEVRNSNTFCGRQLSFERNIACETKFSTQLATFQSAQWSAIYMWLSKFLTFITISQNHSSSKNLP